MKAVASKIKIEADTQVPLDNDEHNVLTTLLKTGKNGYVVKKNDLFEDGALKEEFVSIFELLQIEYDSENNKYYDLSCEETTFLLPLIPEKYFR